jgi:hypothetical protein
MPFWSTAFQAVYALIVFLSQYARARERHRIPLHIKKGPDFSLSAGPHSELIMSVIENFATSYIPGGELVYVGDTGAKWGYVDNELLSGLGVQLEQHGKMPDVIVYDRARHWLVLVEAVASSGPIDSGRHMELSKLFGHANVGLVYVTAFPDRGEIFKRFLSVVAWETEVWCASDPTHLIHFNGERFLGSYGAPPAGLERRVLPTPPLAAHVRIVD